MPSTPTEEGGYHQNASTLLEHWKKCGAAKVPAESCGEEELSCTGVTPLVLAGREVLWFETSLVVTRGVWVRTALILMLKVEDECMMKRTRMVEMTSSHSRGPTFFWITLHSMLQWSFGVEGGREGGRERESRNHLNGHGMGAQATWSIRKEGRRNHSQPSSSSSLVSSTDEEIAEDK
ncbi:hypothetical protein B296_00037513 [Ensete ventricosum]|uniref:Uncharacterized protein n=1 Tax=Ensete ventricosum TaxID=4639 RepID=A0A426XGC9_ENSVE|nr:hypothetical protein B296_00037513 [Ensete ventricosum]